MQTRFSYFIIPFLLMAGMLMTAVSEAQIIITGTVYDSSKLYVVPDVEVSTTSGKIAFTDSLGKYSILAQQTDSIRFFYNGKYTLPFAVAAIDARGLDISLRVPVKNKYRLLEEVTVFSNSYRQDSLEQRERFAKLFEGKAGSVSTNYTPGGAAGIDLEELIGLFQFRRNKQRQAFQQMLIREEQERYIDYRFSPQVITRATGLAGEQLEEYRKLYRPSYYFVQNSTILQFYQYILKTSYEYKRRKLIE